MSIDINDLQLQVFEGLWGDRYDWGDPHRQKTPMRFLQMMAELTDRKSFEFTTFEDSSDEMVIIKDIQFTSVCAHHLAPFMGVCHVGYVPDGKLAGLSKFARLVRWCAADLTVQEHLTQEIANRLDLELRPKGVAVVMEAEHLCMTIRGVQAPGTKTITSVMEGVYAEHDRLARQEFLGMIGKG